MPLYNVFPERRLSISIFYFMNLTYTIRLASVVSKAINYKIFDKILLGDKLCKKTERIRL